MTMKYNRENQKYTFLKRNVHKFLKNDSTLHLEQYRSNTAK